MLLLCRVFTAKQKYPPLCGETFEERPILLKFKEGDN